MQMTEAQFGRGRPRRFAPGLAALIFLLAGTASMLQAGFVNGSTGSWQPFPSALNEDNDPYFDNPSFDGAQAGIAYYLSGGGPYAAISPNITPVWWGNPDGSPDPNVYFSTNEFLDGKLVLEVANLKDVNEIGWYDTSLANPALNPIFPGSASEGATIVFLPSVNFGLYIKNDQMVFFSQSSRNDPSEQNKQHFAIFRQDTPIGPYYWIGAEDTPQGAFGGLENRGDFNDLVVRVTENPEPGSLLLMGGGLLALWMSRKRRRLA